MVKTVNWWVLASIFSLLIAGEASSFAGNVDDKYLKVFPEILVKPECEFTSSDTVEIIPVSKTSLINTTGDILFLRSRSNKSGAFEWPVQSVLFTSACDGRSNFEMDLKENSYSSSLITNFFQTLLSIPSLVDSGQDFNFLWQFFARFSNTDYLELFYSLPDVSPYPLVSYRGHWIEIPELPEHGALWFPDFSHDELLPHKRLLMPVSASVVSMLSDIVMAVNAKVVQKKWSSSLVCDEQHSQLCEFKVKGTEKFPVISQHALLMQDSSVIIPLAGMDNMSTLHIDRSGQLALEGLQWSLEQLDILHLSYLPCPHCIERFDAAVKRRFSSSMSFSRFMGLFSHQNAPAPQIQPPVGQLVELDNGPGGPDDFPMFSDEANHFVFPGDIPTGRQAARKRKTKADKQESSGTTGGKGGGQGAARKDMTPQPRHIRFWDESGDGRDPDKRGQKAEEREEEKQSIKKKFETAYGKVKTATKKLIEDMDQEIGYLVNSLKDKKASTPDSIAKERKEGLAKWVYVIKTGPGGKTSKISTSEITDKDVLNLELELEAIEEEYVVEPETGAVLADGKRRVSVVAPQDVEPALPLQPSLDGEDELRVSVVEEEHTFDSETPRLIALGRRRASSVAGEHVNAFRGRLHKLLEGEKDVGEMSRAELRAASQKIDRLLDDELTLRHEELNRLDGGRTRLAQEIVRKKEELDKLHHAWFNGKNKNADRVGAELETLQLKAQEVCEKYAAMHAYDARYRHWTSSLLKTEFDQAAYERLKHLQNSGETVLGSFKVAYFGRHWKNLATLGTAHPSLAFAEREVAAEVLPEPKSFLAAHGGTIAITLSGIMASLGGGYYFSDSIYDAYQWLTGESSTDKDDEEQSIPVDDEEFD